MFLTYETEATPLVFLTCQTKTEDAEEYQDVERHNGILDGSQGVEVAAALILLPGPPDRACRRDSSTSL